MTELLGRRVPPTGVFASNINQAVGAIAGARIAGRSIPADVSLVGYDDDPLCDVPGGAADGDPDAAVRAGPGRRRRADRPGRRLAGPRDITVETAPELVVRESTAPPTVAMMTSAPPSWSRPRARSSWPTWSSTRPNATRCWCGCSRRASAAATSPSWTANGPPPLPIVLGHEGAGVIEAVGEGVDEPASASAWCSPSRRPAAAAGSASRVAPTCAPRRPTAWTRARCATARRDCTAATSACITSRLVSSFAEPRGRACQRRDPGDRPARTRPGVPARLRRDHRRDVCDAPRKRSPWRLGGGVRLRRRRPRGGAGSGADLGATR